MKRVPDRLRKELILATRVSPEQMEDIETAAALAHAVVGTYIRDVVVKAVRAALKKAGKKPATG